MLVYARFTKLNVKNNIGILKKINKHKEKMYPINYVHEFGHACLLHCSTHTALAPTHSVSVL